MADLQREALVEKAIALINGSHLTPTDKKLITGRIPFVADSMLEMFVEVCEEDPFSIDLVAKSLKRKLETQGNLAKLHQVIEEESKEALEMILAKS